MAETVWVLFEDDFKQVQRFRGPAKTAQDDGQIGSRPHEVGIDLERSSKERLRVFEPPEPCRELGEHADRPNVERILLQVRLENALGDVQAVVMHRGRGLDETWVEMTGQDRGHADTLAQAKRSRQAAAAAMRAQCNISKTWKSAPKPISGPTMSLARKCSSSRANTI